MLSKSKKASRLLFLIPLIAIALTSVYLISVQVAQAERPQPKANRVSPLLKANSHKADEPVAVIVTLNAPKSGPLNAFLNRAGVHPRLEMKRLGTFSLSLPFGMVGELASFPEVSHVSSNEVVHSFGHVTTTTGTDAAHLG